MTFFGVSFFLLFIIALLLFFFIHQLMLCMDELLKKYKLYHVVDFCLFGVAESQSNAFQLCTLLLLFCTKLQMHATIEEVREHDREKVDGKTARRATGEVGCCCVCKNLKKDCHSTDNSATGANDGKEMSRIGVGCQVLKGKQQTKKR